MSDRTRITTGTTKRWAEKSWVERYPVYQAYKEKIVWFNNNWAISLYMSLPEREIIVYHRRGGKRTRWTFFLPSRDKEHYENILLTKIGRGMPLHIYQKLTYFYKIRKLL